MKSKKYILLSILLVMVLLLPTATVSAKNEKTYFIFTEVCDESTIQIGRILETGQANWIAKHFTQTCHETSDSPYVNGAATIDLNLNEVGNGVWFFVGKARYTTEEGGIWNANCLYPWPSPSVQCVGKGEGMYEGLQIFMTGYPGGEWTGYVVEH
jgi:hypothetical protein